MKPLNVYVALLLAGLAQGASQTALDRYVAAPDPTYQFELVSTTPGEGFTTYVLDMTSQQWRTKAEVDRAGLEALVDHREARQLKHRQPASCISPAARINDKPPAAPDPMLPTLALATALGGE